MTSRGNGRPTSYEVRMSQKNRMALKELHRVEALAGKGKEFLASVRQIVERLHKDPLDFGEPLFHLPALKLLVRQAMISRVVVDYAVHEDLPLVFIRGFKVLS